MSAVLPTPKAPSYDELLEKGLAGPNVLVNGESGTGKTYMEIGRASCREKV